MQMKIKRSTEELRNTGVLQGVNFEACWKILRHIFATNVGAGILKRSESFKPSLLRSPSEQKFITADQPVINMKAVFEKAGEMPTELELYYPVSPEIALLLSEVDTRGRPRTISRQAAEYYNRAMVAEAYEQVYAASATDLEPFVRRQ